MKRIFFAFCFGLGCLMGVAKELPEIDYSGLDDVKDFRISARYKVNVEESVPDDFLVTRTHPGIINVKYSDGRLYVTATQVRATFSGGADVKGRFYSNGGVDPFFKWDWFVPAHYIDCTYRYFLDYSFNCKAEGTAHFQIQFNKTCDNPTDVEYAEIPLTEGLDVNIRVDGLYPEIFGNANIENEWLYGKVTPDGQLYGGYAVEKFDGEKRIGENTYHILKRCEGISYDSEKAYEIAYIRHDGVSLRLLPVDRELPLDIWFDGKAGSVNPSKELGQQEISLLDIYNYGEIASFKDVVSGKIEVLPVVAVSDDFNWHDRNYISHWSEKYDMTRQKADLELTRTVDFSGGISMVESVGVIGDCANSLAYPAMICGEEESGNSEPGVQ